MTTQSPQSSGASPTTGTASIQKVIDQRRRAMGITRPTIEPNALSESSGAVKSQALRLAQRPTSEQTEQRMADRDRQREADRAEAERRKLLAKAGAPMLHVGDIGKFTADESDWGAVCSRVCELVCSGAIVVLLGDRGRGKTMLAVEALNAIAVQHKRASRYVTANEMYMQLRDSQSGNEWAVYREFSSPFMLVIDQMEERSGTKFEDRRLFDIVDRRYRDGLATILVSNEKPEAFWPSIGPSLTSRVQQSGELIVCDWGCFR